ncbi:MAG TPA: carboxypeptidase-like regulatory domain-containing protein [Candidatus Limnocylindrales bacterium]|nr:carboxypeptidase-like regulatory domain-containing protein [Candidatus Limnocylindrales bacterium]
MGTAETKALPARRPFFGGVLKFAAPSLALLFLALPTPAQAQWPSFAAPPPSGSSASWSLASEPAWPQVAQQSSGIIAGTVVDQTGAAINGAHIKLLESASNTTAETQSKDDGEFSFVNIPPGAFQLAIEAEGFASQTVSGTLLAGETYAAGKITLAVAAASTVVRVGPQIAEQQIKQQEQQRVLGFVPNFYVTYSPDPVPLSPKQKFELAWKTSIDPITFVLTAGVAGVQQATNEFSGYGQGAQGFGKRFGASYADGAISTFIGGAILPSLLKQDPRYFYKGTGSRRSRLLYAIANAVICKGDNGRWQPNYSGIFGSLATGGISNLYYPASDRNGVALTFENTAIGIGETAAANILQEFIVPRLTPVLSKHQQNKQNPVSRLLNTITGEGD